MREITQKTDLHQVFQTGFHQTDVALNFGIYLYRENFPIILTIAPFSAVVSFLINAVGFSLEWWNLNHYMSIETVSALPLNIGLYPVLGCYSDSTMRAFSAIDAAVHTRYASMLIGY